MEKKGELMNGGERAKIRLLYKAGKAREVSDFIKELERGRLYPNGITRDVLAQSYSRWARHLIKAQEEAKIIVSLEADDERVKALGEKQR